MTARRLLLASSQLVVSHQSLVFSCAGFGPAALWLPSFPPSQLMTNDYLTNDYLGQALGLLVHPS